MGLFSITGDEVMAVLPVSFGERHVERDIQLWADRCPGIINNGLPMLSLGMEIATKFGLYIDNLFLDGNGTLVAAEMKRGRTPREVVAQVIEYASYVSSLDWPALEAFARKVHGRSLDDAFTALFGKPLSRPPKPAYRLLIVAESFDPRVFENALYLINSGTPLALVQFAYYRVGEVAMIDTTTILGEIPDQLPGRAMLGTTPGPAKPATEASGGDEGYSAWLLSTLAEKLKEAAERRGWRLRMKVNQTSLPFADAAWPLTLGDCQLRVDTYKGGVVSLRLHFRREAAPGLAAFLDEHRAAWEESYAGTKAAPTYATPNTVYTLELPRPELGDREAVEALFSKVEAMAAAFLPLVSTYFARMAASAGA